MLLLSDATRATPLLPTDSPLAEAPWFRRALLHTVEGETVGVVDVLRTHAGRRRATERWYGTTPLTALFEAGFDITWADDGDLPDGLADATLQLENSVDWGLTSRPSGLPGGDLKAMWRVVVHGPDAQTGETTPRPDPLLIARMQARHRLDTLTIGYDWSDFTRLEVRPYRPDVSSLHALRAWLDRHQLDCRAAQEARGDGRLWVMSTDALVWQDDDAAAD